MNRAFGNAIAACCAALVLAGCASPSSGLSDLGGGAYSMTKRSALSSQRSAELKSQLELDALKICAARGLALTMLDTRVVDPDPPEYSSATIQFRCVPR